MLLHECAHYVGNRLRHLRMKYYSKAVIRILLEEIIGYYISDTEYEFSSPLNSKGTLWDGAYIVEISEDFKKKIQETTENFIDKKAEELAENFTKDAYPAFCSANKCCPNKLAREDYFSSYVMEALEIFTSNRLFPDRYEQKDAYAWLQETLTEFMYLLRDIAGEILACKTINEQTRSLIQLQLAYSQCAGKVEKQIDYLSREVRPRYHEMAYMLMNVFCDVFADLFAITILKISKEDYAKMYQNYSGASMPQALTRGINLLRMQTIFKVCFQLHGVDGILESFRGLGVTEDVLSEMEAEFQKSDKMTYQEEIVSYAQKCAEQLKEDCEKLNAHDKELLSALIEMYGENADKEIQGIFSFWKYNMEQVDHK